ncbi:type 1 fimbrial protein [Salmonella enterica subsp. enterica]|nr:type 1 fimbrial protein [Salmonella enterica subsp. enterica]
MRFSTNKAILAVAVCSSFVCASAAMAEKGNSVTMRFLGAVTDSTCDVRPFNSAGVDATTINIGTVSKDGKKVEPPVMFYLKPVNCESGPSSTHASILWASPGLSTVGLLNTGVARGVHIKLTPVNDTGANPIDTTSGVQANDIIKEGANIVYYKAAGSDKLTGSFAYKVGLEVDPGATLAPGSVSTDATYTVAYN